MKAKTLNVVLIITSLFGYLEWSGDSHSFLFQAEAEIFIKLFKYPLSVIHPFTILPFIGQVLLLIPIFQKTPSKRLTYVGVGCLGLLIGFMFLIGLLSQNFKITASTLPFLTTAIMAIKYNRKSD